MAGVYSHNRACDRGNWKGESALPGFETYVFVDEIVGVDPWAHFEEDVENFWTLFIQDSILD